MQQLLLVNYQVLQTHHKLIMVALLQEEQQQ